MLDVAGHQHKFMGNSGASDKWIDTADGLTRFFQLTVDSTSDYGRIHIERKNFFPG